MEISERKKKILAAVVDEYIANAEPVGSKLIAEKAGLHVSSATIRNELAELTALGYLEQPHTSAGRVPTAQGYRLYVNELMERHKLSIEIAHLISEGAVPSAEVSSRYEELEKLIAEKKAKLG